MTAHDDRARDEQPARPGCGCQYDAGGRVFIDRCVCPEQPAPTARETCQDPACDREDLGEHHAAHPTAHETAADELAEAVQ